MGAPAVGPALEALARRARAAGPPFARVAAAVLDFFYPPLCLVCRASMPRAEDLVCAACWRAASARPPAREPVVLPGDLPVHAAFGAGPTLFAILHEGKYRGRRTLLDRLGAELAALVARRAALREAALFVPVPLHPGRLRERGFNQSEILARLAASAAGVGGAPLARRLLARRRDTRPQARLAPGRRASNVRGAFRLAAPLPAELKRRRAIVVDDVVTSGATVLECAALLRAAGAGEVHALTLVKG